MIVTVIRKAFSYRLRKLGKLSSTANRLFHDTYGGVFVEYLLLLTIVGIGVIAGLATVRTALIAELTDLANSIAAIN